MKSNILLFGSVLLIAGCGGSSGAPVSAPAAPTAVAPTPPPPPPPVSPTPPPTYIQFADNYIFRQGASISLPSACSSLSFQTQTPAFRSTSAFGQGLSFRYVITPQVWGIGGDGVAASFDGRSADQTNTSAEVAFASTIDSLPVRFSISRPNLGGSDLDYARVSPVLAPVSGITRTYHCVLGVPTLASDLVTSPSGIYRRSTLTGTAHVSESGTVRAYALDRSTVSISSDFTMRRVTVSLSLIGTPSTGVGADIDLGTYTVSAPIDSATDNFVGSLVSATRTVTGTLSGRFFGPQAIEVGAAMGATVPATGSSPGFVFTAAGFGIR